jgi:chromosome segregation ATPase
MYPEEEKLYKMEMKVGLLEKDIQQTNQVYEKLSESIEKIQQMNDTMIRMITIHEQRHEHHAKAEEDLKNDIKELHSEDIKELHSRITTVSRELHDRIDQVERHITERLDDLRNELIKHAKTDPNRLSNTLQEINKYKWMLLGGAATLGWLFGNINLGVLGTIIK